MEEKNGIENEIKLIKANFKTNNIQNKSEEIEKILSVCKIHKISISAEKNIEITDEYYDTANDYLSNKGFSLRKRTEKLKDDNISEYLITIKSKLPAQNTIGFARKEWECKYDKQDAEKIVVDSSKITDIITDEFENKLSIPGELIKKITLKNSRTSITIKTRAAEYSLCMDKYCFISSNEKYSEYQYEIEIEKQGGFIGNDDQVKKLHDEIKKSLDYVDANDSKYKRASNWLKDHTQRM